MPSFGRDRGRRKIVKLDRIRAEGYLLMALGSTFFERGLENTQKQQHRGSGPKGRSRTCCRVKDIRGRAYRNLKKDFADTGQQDITMLGKVKFYFEGLIGVEKESANTRVASLNRMKGDVGDLKSHSHL